MPLDQVPQITWPKCFLLLDAMFEHRPPIKKAECRWEFEQMLHRQDVNELVALAGKFGLLIAQNADKVPTCKIVAFRTWDGLNEEVYFTPHGVIDYYVRRGLDDNAGAVGTAPCYCYRHVSEDASAYLKIIERQHNRVHTLRRKALQEEREFNSLLVA
jgi:hypothetical protein